MTHLRSGRASALVLLVATSIAPVVAQATPEAQLIAIQKQQQVVNRHRQELKRVTATLDEFERDIDRVATGLPPILDEMERIRTTIPQSRYHRDQLANRYRYLLSRTREFNTRSRGFVLLASYRSTVLGLSSDALGTGVEFGFTEFAIDDSLALARQHAANYRGTGNTEAARRVIAWEKAHRRATALADQIEQLQQDARAQVARHKRLTTKKAGVETLILPDRNYFKRRQ